MSANVPASREPKPTGLRAFALGWNGAKLFLALFVIPFWNRREWIPRWYFGSAQAFYDSGYADWWELLQTGLLAEADFYLLLAQIWLLVTALGTLWNSPHWRTGLFCGASLWLWWGTNDFWSSNFFRPFVTTPFGEQGLLRISTLWFSFYSALIAWLWWDDERLTVRLIVGTLLSTVLFRFWIFAGMGSWFTAWIVLISVHFVIVAIGAGALRLWGWQWRGPLTSCAALDAALPAQVNERHQFRFVHLLLAIACAAVLVVGLRPDTQLYQDLSELFKEWLAETPRDVWLVLAVPLLSAAIGLCSLGALFSRRWWWPLLGAVAMGLAATALVPSYESYSIATQNPNEPYVSAISWPRMSWDWVQWTGHLIVTPWALLGAHRAAGYRWERYRQPGAISSHAAARRP